MFEGHYADPHSVHAMTGALVSPEFPFHGQSLATDSVVVSGTFSLLEIPKS